MLIKYLIKYLSKYLIKYLMKYLITYLIKHLIKYLVKYLIVSAHSAWPPPCREGWRAKPGRRALCVQHARAFGARGVGCKDRGPVWGVEVFDRNTES